jgi:hypothetical protein
MAETAAISGSEPESTSGAASVAALSMGGSGAGAGCGKAVKTLAQTEHLTFEPVGLSILSSRLKLVLHASQVIIMAPLTD